ARVDDLSRLVPGAAGEFQADAWLRWRDKRLSGELSGAGSRLAAAGLRVATARVKAQLGGEPGYPVHLDASLTGVAVGQLAADAAQLTLDGNAARHTLQARLTSAGGEALATLNGGLNNGVWRGELT